ncbi:MAG: VCBS repeat-containing protein [Candidatus Omnitrophota bacterium]
MFILLWIKKYFPLAALLIMSVSVRAWAGVDLNGDGYMDIVVAEYKSDSMIYWGDADNSFSQTTALATTGACGSSTADLNGDGYLDIVFANFKDDSVIYWGDPDSSYSTSGTLMTDSATGSFICDLNKDRRMDIVFSNYKGDSVVYWGSENEPFTQTTYLATDGAYGNSVADLNNDGYLDIIFANNKKDSIIYFGDPAYSYSEYMTLGTNKATSVSAADLNYDSHMDIVFSDFVRDSVIYWGDAANTFSDVMYLATKQAEDVFIVDSNADSFPDILFLFSNKKKDSIVYIGADEDPYLTFESIDINSVYDIAVSGMEIVGSSSTYGNVVPLWVTRDIDNYWVVGSSVYQYIRSKHQFLNGGVLSFTDEEVAGLTTLYFDGEAGLNTTPLTINEVQWSYFGQDIPGHVYYDSWYDGTYYFYLGSGLAGTPMGSPGGGIPELPPWGGVVILFSALWVKKISTYPF